MRRRAAVAAGLVELMDRLLKGGFRLDAPDRYGRTPLLEAAGAKPAPGAAAADVPALLTSPLRSGEAIVWALGHCASTVKTRARLLIFDYITGRGPKPEQPSLANGFVNPEEIKGQNVIVFVSHAHPDHFDRVILSWRSIVKNVTYVFGWRADLDQGTIELPTPVIRPENKGDRFTLVR